ncbi:MAG: cupin domain-containing protein [Calditrichaeota bacterium]|nr:MAG: cupin domain-containing protein [Calditrichota bacterium]
MKTQPEVQRLVQLIDYQAGGIVSRSLLKKESGSVTLFAFAAGEKLSEHTAPYDALVQVLEGEAEIVVGKTPFVVKAGEMLHLPADVPHAVQARSNFKMVLTMLRA